MNPIVNELLARQRVQDALRAAERQRLLASLPGGDDVRAQPGAPGRAREHRTRRALVRWIGAGASLTI